MYELRIFALSHFKPNVKSEGHSRRQLSHLVGMNMPFGFVPEVSWSRQYPTGLHGNEALFGQTLSEMKREKKRPGVESRHIHGYVNFMAMSILIWSLHRHCLATRKLLFSQLSLRYSLHLPAFKRKRAQISQISQTCRSRSAEYFSSMPLDIGQCLSLLGQVAPGQAPTMEGC